MNKPVLCLEWEAKLALRQEDFSPSEWNVFQTHIRACSVCATRRAEYGVLVTELQMLPPPKERPPFRFPFHGELCQRLEQANLLFGLQRYEEVLAVAEQICQLHGNRPEGWRIKARAFSLLGCNQEALNACHTALELGADTVEVRKIQARSLLLLGRYREALRACDCVSEATTSDAELWQIKASVLFFLDREQEGQEGEEDLLRLDPNYVIDVNAVDVWVDQIKMRCSEERWRYEQALDACDRALCLNPKMKAVCEIKGRVLIALGCYEEAVDTFKYCISLDPDDAEEWRFLGCVFSRLGQDEKAWRAYKRAEEIDPNREDVWGQRTAPLLC